LFFLLCKTDINSFRQMGKNTGPGGKNRRKGKSMTAFYKRDLRVKEEYEDYAVVEKMLGDERTLCTTFDGVQRVCHIRGKFRKRVWINTGDVVLISLREFQQDKADIVYKYTSDEIRLLKDQNEIPPDEEQKDDAEEDVQQDLFVEDATTDAPDLETI